MDGDNSDKQTVRRARRMQEVERSEAKWIAETTRMRSKVSRSDVRAVLESNASVASTHRARATLVSLRLEPAKRQASDLRLSSCTRSALTS